MLRRSKITCQKNKKKTLEKFYWRKNNRLLNLLSVLKQKQRHTTKDLPSWCVGIFQGSTK